jgi:hypothetical protein
MAYLNFLLSVPESGIEAIRADSAQLLRPSLRVSVSHLLAYWVKIQPLGRILGEAIDGGEVLGDAFWHPLRSPVYHRPARVRTLHLQLDEVWEQASNAQADEDALGGLAEREIQMVIQVFTHASARGECIASVLAPPDDADRRNRTRMPFSSTEPAVVPEADAQKSNASVQGDEDAGLALSSVIGLLGGGLALGAFGLCYWRYRRLAKPRY